MTTNHITLPREQQFRKKPVVITAVQFTEALRDAIVLDGVPCPAGVHRGATSWHQKDRKVWRADFYIDTLEGRMRVDLDDWIITGVKGEHYACKADIFAATYESAAQQPEPAAQAQPSEANVEKLRSAVNLALTYFGMDEDESNREVFKALREADEQTPTLAAHINRCVTLFGSLRKMADALDMDAGYLSRLRSGEKIEPSAEVLSKLGLRKTVTYSKTDHGTYEATPLIPRTRSA